MWAALAPGDEPGLSDSPVTPVGWACSPIGIATRLKETLANDRGDVVRVISAVAALLVVGGLVLTACGGSAAGRLEALRSAPMADYQLAGAVDSTRNEVEGGTGRFGGKSTPSRISLSFVVADNDLQPAFEETVAAAIEAGYVDSVERDTDSAYAASQTVDGRVVLVEVIQSAADATVLVGVQTYDV